MKHLFSLASGSTKPWHPGCWGRVLLGLCGLALVATPAQAQFAPYTSIGTEVAPTMVLARDLNADGRPDLLASCEDATRLNRFLGQAGIPAFSARSSIAAGGARPHALALGDLNGDGWNDVVVTNTSGPNLSVLLSQAGGIIISVTTIGVGIPTYAVKLADINGDGNLDALVAGTGTSLYVLLGQGNGSFGPASAYSTGATQSVADLALADVNGDNRPDAVVSNLFDASVAVLVNLGGGAFGPPTAYPTRPGPYGVELRDVSGDGRPDIVVANSTDNSVGVLLGQPGGQFAAMVRYAVSGASPRHLTLADLDGNGALDVAVAYYSSPGAVGVLLNRGNGTFDAPTNYPTGGPSFDVAAADLNLDGKPDLAVTHPTNNTLSVLLSTAVFPPTVTGTSRCGVGSVTLTAGGAPAGGSYRWYTQATGGTAIGGATGSSYATPTLYATTTYYVSVVDAAGTESPRTPVTATIRYTMPPSIVASGPTTISPGGSVQLTARPNLALRFNGNADPATNQYVNTPLNAQPSALPSTTWEAWVYPTRLNHPVRQTVFSVDNGEFDRTVVLEAGSDEWGIFVGDVGFPASVWRPVQADVNQWQHIAVVYTPAGVRFYKNGVEYVYSGPYLEHATSNPFTIGRNPEPAWQNEAWEGQIDEVRVWSTARSQADIQSTMYSAPAGSTAGLVGYWRFNEGSGSVTRDETGANNGTIGNAAPYVTPGTTGIGASTFAWSPATGLSATNTATVTASPATTTPYTVSVSDGTCSNSAQQTVTVTGGLPDLVVSTPQAVTGAYNNVTVTGTGAATLSGPLTVNGTMVVQPGGVLNTNCQIISGPGSFALAANATLQICDPAGLTSSGATGAVQVSGPRRFSRAASYVYNGAAAQVTGSGLPDLVRNLTINNPTSVTLSQPMAVRRLLTLSRGNFELSGRMLTLRSDADSTALALHADGALINGNVTVQRFIPANGYAGPGYRHMASPMGGGRVSSLATPGFTPVLNQAYNTSATPNLVTPFPNVFTYQEGRTVSSPATVYSPFDRGWVSPGTSNDLSELLYPITGYAVHIAANQTINFVGTLTTTSYSQLLSRSPGTDAGWFLAGNPYPSELDWRLMPQEPTMTGAMYVYQSTGPYVGSYRSYTNGVGGNPMIGMGQAFFVRVAPGSTFGSITANGAARVATFGSNAGFQRTTETRPLLQLTLQGAGSRTDETYVYFEAGATAGEDNRYDAAKLPNSHGLNLASVAAGTELSINGLPPLSAATVVPLVVSVSAAGTYTLRADQLLNLDAAAVYLRDAVTGQLINLRQQPAYTFTTTGAARLTGRFSVQFNPGRPSAAQTGLTAAALQVYPNPAQSSCQVQVPAVTGASQVRLALYTALGQLVREQVSPLGAAGLKTSLDLRNLAEGIYTLQVQAGASTVIKRLAVSR